MMSVLVWALPPGAMAAAPEHTPGVSGSPEESSYFNAKKADSETRMGSFKQTWTTIDCIVPKFDFLDSTIHCKNAAGIFRHATSLLDARACIPGAVAI
jgi:hypothetical protein